MANDSSPDVAVLLEDLSVFFAARDKKKVGNTIKSLRKNVLNATLRDFGNLLGVTSQAVSRWEAGNLPRETYLETIRQRVGERVRGGSAAAGVHWVALREGRYLAIRPIDGILALERHCRHVYIFKTSQQFLSGEASTTREEMIRIVRERRDQGRDITFHFIFVPGTDAAESFKKFKNYVDAIDAVSETRDKLAKYIEKHDEIDEKLRSVESSWVVMVYDPDYAPVARENRSVFLEVRTVTYGRPDVSVKNSGEETLWLQLSDRVADELVNNFPKIFSPSGSTS